MNKKSPKIIMFSFIILLFAIGGCNIGVGELPGGGGGIDTQPRYIDGRYQSQQGKVIEFSSKEKKYRLYMNKTELQEANPSIIAEYKILGQQIIFYKETGEEYEDRGILRNNDREFTWDEFPNEVFVLVQ